MYHSLEDFKYEFDNILLGIIMKKDKIDNHVDEECPECAKHQKHVKLVENNGRIECRSCRYYRQLMR